MVSSGNRSIIFLDTETTGLNHRVHELISIGMIEVEESWDNGVLTHRVFDEVELKIKPQNFEMADPVAFRINGYSPERWQDALTPAEALEPLAARLFDPDPQDPKINRLMVAGHNVHFDILMIAAYFSRHDLTWHPRNALDTYTLARKVFSGDVRLPSYALHNVCEYYGIENEVAHTALSDARACLAIYQRMMGVRNA